MACGPVPNRPPWPEAELRRQQHALHERTCQGTVQCCEWSFPTAFLQAWCCCLPESRRCHRTSWSRRLSVPPAEGCTSSCRWHSVQEQSGQNGSGHTRSRLPCPERCPRHVQSQ